MTKITFEDLYKMKRRVPVVMKREESLLNAIFLSKEEQQKKFMKAYFDALCKAFVQGDIAEVYQVFAECLSEYHERVVMEDYSYLSDFSAYINPEKKTSIIKFNEDGATFRAKCDDSDEFNPMAGVAIAFMKGALGHTNSQEFRKMLEGKMVDTSKKQETNLNTEATTSKVSSKKTENVSKDKTSSDTVSSKNLDGATKRSTNPKEKKDTTKAQGTKKETLTSTKTRASNKTK